MLSVVITTNYFPVIPCNSISQKIYPSNPLLCISSKLHIVKITFVCTDDCTLNAAKTSLLEVKKFCR